MAIRVNTEVKGKGHAPLKPIRPGETSASRPWCGSAT
jgi:hypothetical protein